MTITKIFLTTFIGFIGIPCLSQIQPSKPLGFAKPTLIHPGQSPTRSSMESVSKPPVNQSSNLSPYQQKKQLNQLRQIRSELKPSTSNISYDLPSFAHIPSTQFYREAFKKLSKMDANNFSVKEAVFLIENAYYEEQKKFEEFSKIIEQSGDFLRSKIKESGYDTQGNLVKNFMLFRFFTDTLVNRSRDLKHFPLQYDFEDYMGIKDWSKMLVTKLLTTGKGQCNSLPLLYLILAEEIDAEAFLSLSPNHSYIKIRDKNNKWHNIELTNGMITSNAFIMQSGYIKAEALQNEIYMQEMTKKQLFSQLLTTLAQGYLYKFGYDGFVDQVISKALSLYPNNINANMVKEDYMTVQFLYVTRQLDINPRNHDELQTLKNYSRGLRLLEKVNQQQNKVDNLGYAPMPAKAYEKWLKSLKEVKQKRENKEIEKQFNIQPNRTIKN